MAAGRYQFASFRLDPIERRLFAGDVPVELNTRYFDALLLLLQHPGTLRLAVVLDRYLSVAFRHITSPALACWSQLMSRWDRDMP